MSEKTPIPKSPKPKIHPPRLSQNGAYRRHSWRKNLSLHFSQPKNPATTTILNSSWPRHSCRKNSQAQDCRSIKIGHGLLPILPRFFIFEKSNPSRIDTKYSRRPPTGNPRFVSPTLMPEKFQTQNFHRIRFRAQSIRRFFVRKNPTVSN